MMDYEDFKNNLMDYVSEEIDNRGLEDISLKFQEIDSPDGVTDRLIVSIGDSKMSMAFRLSPVFDAVQNGESIEDAAYQVVDTIEENISVCKTKVNDVKDFVTDYDKVKDHTYLRMIPGNSPILKETPHRKFEDMALVVNIHLDSFMSKGDGKSVVVISNPLMEMYGIDEKQLFADAEKNSLENEPMVIIPLGDMIHSLIRSEGLPEPEDVGVFAYVASTKSGFQGAAVAGYPDFCERAAETIGGSFYMLPSSVHEFILVKDDGNRKAAKDFNNMVKQVNATVVGEKDFLSDQCYHYDAKSKVLESGIKYEKRLNRDKNER